jgi:outer membrane protein assembly factor BamB
VFYGIPLIIETCYNVFLLHMKKVVLLAFLSVLMFGTLLLIAVTVQGFLSGAYPLQRRNENEYALLWKQPAVSGQDNWGTATYQDGVLYTVSKSYSLVYAINASNGDIIWKTVVKWSGTSPCIDGDVIYVGETHPGIEKPRAMALNRTTGEEIWNFVDIAPDDYAWVGDPLVTGDYVYYTTWGSVYALNKTNGSLIWHENCLNMVVCSMAYHADMVFVTALSPSGTYAFNATTGDMVWHAPYGGSWDSSPVIYDGMVIQAYRPTEGYTCAFNETSGELIRKFPVGTLSTPLVHNGKIFIPTSRVLWAFDLTTGDELWHTVELHDGTYQERSYSSPAGAGGAIYYQSLNGTFYVIDEANGSICWSYALDGLGFGGPSIGDGCVFITNDAGLYAFRISPDLGSGDWPMYCQNHQHISYFGTTCPSSISCSISFAEVTIGDFLTVSGSLSPKLSNQVVTIIYTKPDDSTLIRVTTTSSDGSYSDSVTFSAIGLWSVMASWEGDSMYSSATSSSQSFQVNPQPLLETPLGVAIVGGGIAVLIAGVVLVLRTRRPQAPNKLNMNRPILRVLLPSLD